MKLLRSPFAFLFRDEPGQTGDIRIFRVIHHLFLRLVRIDGVGIMESLTVRFFIFEFPAARLMFCLVLELIYNVIIRAACRLFFRNLSLQFFLITIIAGAVLVIFASSVVEDVVGSGEQLERVTFLVHFPPLIVDVKDSCVCFPVNHAGLAVAQLNGMLSAGRNRMHVGRVSRPLERREVGVVILSLLMSFRLIPLCRFIAAEQDRGCGCGRFQCFAEVSHIIVKGRILLFTDADMLLHLQHDTVHLAGAVALPIGVRHFNAPFHFVQRQLASECSLLRCAAVADGQQRIVAGVLAVCVEVFARQRINLIDLVGEVFHIGADVCILYYLFSPFCIIIFRLRHDSVPVVIV